MLNETPLQLVKHLKHPNGWWRDTARKLIILKGDKSIVNHLLKMLMNSKLKSHSRVAAIWTLEGLDVLTPEIITNAMQSQEIEVQIAAAQAGRKLIKRNGYSPARLYIIIKFCKNQTCKTRPSCPSKLIQFLQTRLKSSNST